MLTEARLVLREGVRVLEAVDAHAQQQLVLVEERGMVISVRLASGERHPVVGIVGEELVPLLEPLLVDEPRLVVHELRQRREIRSTAHGRVSGAMNCCQARYWPRIE